MSAPAPRAVQAVLFDLGATLLYFDAPWTQVLELAYETLHASLVRAGLALPKAQFVPDFRRQMQAYYVERDTEFIEHTTLYVLRSLLAQLGHPDVAESILAPALQEMYAITQAHWQLEADAIPTLEALRQVGYSLGLISNAGHDADVQTLIDNHGLRPYFDVILTSAAQGIRKPNPRLFDLALSHWGIPPIRAVMVGDTLGADILGAQNAGIFSIWITRRADTPANRSHRATIHPDATIATLSDLPHLLNSINVK